MSKTRKGLTLLELVIVLVILVALAGILVPLLPGMLSRAHVAEHSTNVAELNKAWELYNITNRAYPDGLDSLVDRGGGDIYDKLPGADISGLFTARSLTDLAADVGGGAAGADLVERLAEFGLKNVYEMDNATTNATFEPYGAGVVVPTATPLTETVKLCAVRQADVVAKLNARADGVFVIFGVGPRCSIVGRGGIANAPIHFSDEAGDAGNPANVYARFGVVYDLKPNEPQCVGVVAFHGDGISGMDDAMEEFYNLR